MPVVRFDLVGFRERVGFVVAKHNALARITACTSDRLDLRAVHRRAMRGATAAKRAATNVVAVRSARRRE